MVIGFRHLSITLLRISYLEHKTNEWVRSKINFLLGPWQPPLTTVKRRTLAWFGHVICHDSLSKTILQGTLPWTVGDAVVDAGNAGWTTSKSGHPRPCQLPLKVVSRRKDWKRISAESSPLPPPPDEPIGQGTELN